MKRLGLSLISATLILGTLTACGSNQTLPMNNAQFNQQMPIQMQSTGTATLSMNKQSDNTAKKAEADKDSKLNSSVSNKANANSSKNAVNLVIKYSNAPAKNSRGSREAASIARYTLRSMDRASSYSEGYRIGIRGLRELRDDGVYVGRLGWSAANATKEWDNGYKVASVALEHLAYEKPNTPNEACNLVMRMMDAANSYADGYRAGYAALEKMGQTNNRSLRRIIDLALSQADRTRDWHDGYDIIQEALREIRREF